MIICIFGLDPNILDSFNKSQSFPLQVKNTVMFTILLYSLFSLFLFRQIENVYHNRRHQIILWLNKSLQLFQRKKKLATRNQKSIFNSFYFSFVVSTLKFSSSFSEANSKLSNVFWIPVGVASATWIRTSRAFTCFSSREWTRSLWAWISTFGTLICDFLTRFWRISWWIKTGFGSLLRSMRFVLLQQATRLHVVTWCLDVIILRFVVKVFRAIFTVHNRTRATNTGYESENAEHTSDVTEINTRSELPLNVIVLVLIFEKVAVHNTGVPSHRSQG